MPPYIKTKTAMIKWTNSLNTGNRKQNEYKQALMCNSLAKIPSRATPEARESLLKIGEVRCQVLKKTSSIDFVAWTISAMVQVLLASPQSNSIPLHVTDILV